MVQIPVSDERQRLSGKFDPFMGIEHGGRTAKEITHTGLLRKRIGRGDGPNDRKHDVKILCDTQRPSSGTCAGGLTMGPIIIQGLSKISDFAFERHCSKDLVIAAKAQSLVSSPHPLVDVLAEEDRTRVRNWRGKHKETPAFLKTIHDEVRRPMVWVQAIQVRICKPKALIIFPNTPRAAIRECYLRLLIQDRNHLSQEARIRVIVGLGDPNVAPTRHLYAFVPLLERGPGIFRV